MKKHLFLISALLLLALTQSKASVIIKNGLTHLHHLNNSGTQKGFILIANTGEKKQRVKLYFNDLSIECSGAINYTEPADNYGSLFPFINVDNSDITLEAHEEYKIIYEIDLSKGDVENRSLWSLIMVEVEEPIAIDKKTPGFEIGTKIRYAIQVVANVGKNTVNGLKFTDIKLGKDENQKRVIKITLKNDGEFLVYPKMELQVFDENGNEAKKVDISPRNVYPKNCQSLNIDLSDLALGNYKAVLFAEFEDDAIGVNLDLAL
ncbi:hypothetical protein [Arcticibacterium luteifluviistationis]|uniref:DUF3324 domain-containing protein n=1 Tax=Arcticibacterium luteifluviistationis TaxID=1784714 RepID=A0A2Z4G8Y0_9BACT|nr:hypothetical protein [Arcticibacterium luteifluviistationis]AWV97393.1 hypothetical protein DJ013_04080 [Arcticibacterium luteifluviistationis]